MAAEPARLLELAEAIAEGRDVDWADAEATAGSLDDRAIIAQLRLLAGVADLHRHSGEVADHDVVDDPLIGTRWGTLDIKALIGAGSFGSVYRAHDTQLDREVALKLIRGTPTNEDEVLREGRLLARIRHPHVVSVYGVDRIGGRVGLWMELIRGRTLEDLLQQDGPLGAREAAAIGIDLCGALAAVHAQGLVHGDVKARNVMREDGGRIVLMDFGASRDVLTQDGSASAVGTPLYMAPEVVDGGVPTPQSDIYSLGVVIFRAVTGRFPIEGRTRSEVVAAHEKGERRRIRDTRPDLPPWFVSAVETALAPDPRSRYATLAAFEAGLGAATTPRRDTKTWLMAAGLVVALAAVVAFWSASRRPTSTTSVTGVLQTIGVLPMKNLTGDSGQDYFAAGLTEVLVAHLGAIRALRVLPLNAPLVNGAGADFRLDGHLETSVQRSAGRVRVTARLMQAGGGAVLWGGNYDGADSEAFMLQGRIAADLARDLGVAVTDVESRRLTRRYVANPGAQDAYLRGRYLLDTHTRENFLKARIEFEEAIRLAPDYAPAYAGLATTFMEMAVVGLLTPREVRALAIPAADRAVKEDPLLAEAVLARADVRFRLEWDWLGADADYQTAISLNPSDIRAIGRYARFLAADERLDEAQVQAREALSLDPLSAEIHGVVGVILYYQRRYDEAIAHFQERLGERSPGYVGLGRALAGAGRYPEALDALTIAYERSGRDPAGLAELARTWAAAGEAEKARQTLAELSSRHSAGATYVSPQDLAFIHIALGEHDRAFALLSTALDERASRLLWLTVDPRVDAVRGDARFAQLMMRLGRKSER